MDGAYIAFDNIEIRKNLKVIYRYSVQAVLIVNHPIFFCFVCYQACQVQVFQAYTKDVNNNNFNNNNFI